MQPAKAKGRWRFSFAAPSPAFFQSRDNRPRRTQLQFPCALRGNLGEKKGWGKFYLASENVISTDAFDTSARIGTRLGVEHPIYKTGPLLSTEMSVVTNQRGQNQAFGANMGTRWSLPIRIGIGRPDLQTNFLGYENRRRLNYETSPSHTGRNVLVSSASLFLPPICFGEGDIEKRPHLLFRTSSWFFANESAAPGYSPRNFERRYETAFIIPSRSLRKKISYVKAIALSYISGANDGNDYASQRNFRVNFILVDTRRLFDELAEHRVLPKMPEILSPRTKQDSKSEDKKTDNKNPSTKP